MRRTEEGEGGGEMLSQRSCRDHCTPSACGVLPAAPLGGSEQVLVGPKSQQECG